MRIALISTYPPAECGIGNYCRELRRALAHIAPDAAVTVLAERTPKAIDSDTLVTRAWDRRGNWLDELTAAVKRADVDVVHIQHEESHFGQDARFLTLLARLRTLGVRTVVTMHSVYDRVFELPGRLAGRSFHRGLAHACDAIVAHQEAGMADVLRAHGVPDDRIVVIPHGTPRLDLPDRAAARARLGIPNDAPTALFFGFIHRLKNVDIVVRAFERVSVDLPHARLVIAGRIRSGRFADRYYAAKLQYLMAGGISEGRILYRPGFVADADKPAYFAAADVLLLPHHQRYGSASGVLHEGLGARRAIMCARGKKFAEAVDQLATEMPFATPHARDVGAWEIGLERLLGNAVDRERATTLVERLADVTSWQASARQHADLYRSVCRGITNEGQVG